ncbi:MAG TPA: dethiobiotin synthase [Streptosporangiaceae bacterium]|nr:dethiobiotin synthase [Streptosporangiaceae bacterium]
MNRSQRILIVTGTGTGVGKTVVTAALAALAKTRGSRVAVVKPAQTGVPAEAGLRGPGEKPQPVAAGPEATNPPCPGTGAAQETSAGDEADLEVVRRLARVTDLHELARFPDPLSPEAAARAAGLPPLDLHDAAGYVGELSRTRDLVLVEGAGGLLVRYDPAGTTLADLAKLLDAGVLVVTEPGLGTLNHTALTLEGLAARGLALAGLVIGRWPADPGLAERSNLADFEAIIGGPIAGVLPDGCGMAAAPQFLAAARAGLTPKFGGEFDPAVFTEAVARTERKTLMWKAPA